MIVSMSPKSYSDGCLNSTSSVRTEFLVGTGPVHSLAFTADGRRLASEGGLDSATKLSEVAISRRLHSISVGTSDITSVAFTSDASWLALANRDSDSIRLWDVSAKNL
jgi:WD40 repeat protein